VRKALLLLVEPGILERERGLARDRERELEIALAERPARIERDQCDRAQHLRRRRDRNDRRGRAALEEGDEQPVSALEPGGYAGIEQQRPPAGEETVEPRRQRLRPQQDRLDRFGH